MGHTLTRLCLVALVALSAFAWAVAHPGGRAQACGAAGPFDFDTYEAEDYATTYAKAIELAAAGKAITSSYKLSSTNELIDVRYLGLLEGPRGARTTKPDTSLAIPPTIYKSIAWIEANWNNAAGTVPYGGVGPVLRSFDCGYGVGQVTTGMSNATGVASARQAVIGTHFLFNIAEGVRILADKWNSAPKYRPVAGNGDPAAIEDWYFAIWSYNGFAFSNHPLNPNLDPLRGGGTSPIYHCYDPSAPSYQDTGDGPQFGYGEYTYQERVYGCMRYPPTKTPIGAPAGTPSVALWKPQTFLMPDFTDPDIASAFDIEAFTACEDAGFSGGCPSMDFPTTIPPDVVPHADTTPPPDPAFATKLLGAPRLTFNGPNVMSLTAYPDGTATSGSFVLENAGKWIGPYRIRVSAPWIVVRHADDPAGRSLDGGVVIGKDTDVVIQQASAGPPARPRIAVKGYKSTLIVTLAVDLMPDGGQTGKVWIEPLLGGGGVFSIDITATKGSNPLPFRAVLPSVSVTD
jgi:hypothetical protein